MLQVSLSILWVQSVGQSCKNCKLCFLEYLDSQDILDTAFFSLQVSSDIYTI